MPRLPDPRFAPDCTLRVDGRPVAARTGEPVAVALLAAGRPLVSRSVKYHRPRGPFCLAGTCGSCLARVDGLPSRRTCRTPSRAGLRVETQHAWPDARRDLLGAIDLLAPGGLDHHHLLTRPPFANRALVAVARRLSGLGRLPDEPGEPGPAPAEERFDAVVVGAGPAGLGAAEVLAAAGRRVLLAEREDAPGGRLRCRLALPGDPPLSWAGEVVRAVGRAGGEAALGASAVGLWRDGGAPLVGLLCGSSMRLVRAAEVVLCPGGTARPPLFEQNDLPGVYWGRGLAAALAEHGAVPGERALVLGPGPEAAALAERLRSAGMAAERVEAGVERARGRSRLSGLVLAAGRRLRCDTAAAVAPPAPAWELARLGGAAVAFDPALDAHAVRAGPGGSTGVPGLRAAGEVTGALSAAEAAEAGRRAAEAALG